MELSDLFKRVNVEIGQGCDISPFCSLENVVVRDHVTISDEVQLKNVVIGSHTKIGRRVTIYSSNSDHPVLIGNYCWFSYGVFGEATGGEIQISDFVVIAHYTTILTSSGPGIQSPIMNSLYPLKIASVFIGTHSWIGTQCVLLPGARLAEGVVIGANSMVSAGSYEIWSVYAGTPARLIKRLDAKTVESIRVKGHPEC